MNRREFLKVAGAAGTLPLFNIGCAGFGRWSGLRGGEKARIAIVGCGDWGGTLLRRAGAVGGCELVAVCEPDPNAMKKFWDKAAKAWRKEDLATAKTYADYRVMFEELRIVREFLGAVRGRPGEINTGLDFSIPLAKTLMLSNALAFAGKGTYSFDGKKTSSEVANAHLGHGYRKGWTLV